MTSCSEDLWTADEVTRMDTKTISGIASLLGVAALLTVGSGFTTPEDSARGVIRPGASGGGERMPALPHH